MYYHIDNPTVPLRSFTVDDVVWPASILDTYSMEQRHELGIYSGIVYGDEAGIDGDNIVIVKPVAPHPLDGKWDLVHALIYTWRELDIGPVPDTWEEVLPLLSSIPVDKQVMLLGLRSALDGVWDNVLEFVRERVGEEGSGDA